MFNVKFTTLVGLFLAAAVVVIAQDTSGVSQIINCVNSAAVNNSCSSFADLSCACTNSDFQTAALACLQSGCTAAADSQEASCATTSA
ncbi:hypothetical protein VKT23_010629 [Stygiomarasmius scandens]|uniref:CFEM domain-containing protein n=1 Tax=Marasmiellus scandens TaxID=2682957 RepID=A0ABR1JE73_9AGAR